MEKELNNLCQYYWEHFRDTLYVRIGQLSGEQNMRQQKKEMANRRIHRSYQTIRNLQEEAKMAQGFAVRSQRERMCNNQQNTIEDMVLKIGELEVEYERADALYQQLKEVWAYSGKCKVCCVHRNGKNRRLIFELS